jgi:hypothetical protein
VLTLVILLVVSQVPAVPGESTLVSFCKQGRLSACQELAKLHPKEAARLQAELARAALGRETLKAAEEAGREEEDSSAHASSEASSSGEPPHCQGQNHHVISHPIHKALKDHPTLRGLYAPRDGRFVAKAKDKEAHCGYQAWHRDVDAEIIQWLENNPAATSKQFMMKLRDIYNRPEMLKRFPHGF